MGNKLIFVMVILLVGGILSAFEIEDVNGTWTYNEEALKVTDLPERKYSWGIGRTIPNSSTDLDLTKGEVLLSGMGLYFVEKAFKDDKGSICLELFSVEDLSHSFLLHMKITFLDYGKVYIVCYPQEGWWSRPLSPEEKWVWYRLSGPPKK